MKREEAVETIEFAKTYIRKDGLIKQALDLALTALRPVSREQVEKMFSGCDNCKPCCDSCERAYAWDKYGKPQRCSGCKENGYQNYKSESKFCENCGKPLTDEAVELVMERWETLKDGSKQ